MSELHGADWAQPAYRLDLDAGPLLVVPVALIALLLQAPVPGAQLVHLELPSCTLSANPQEVLVHELEIEADGTLLWDGQALLNSAELDQKLRALALLRSERQAEVHIRPSPLVDFGAVVAVFAAIQRNGLQRMGIVVPEWQVR